ncbi:MAG: hypothetical protein MR775_01070 [Erysipelotrichaceae bacterium]|nr:hypothetical protein [Erysipelotrichaceae bacterium]
MINKSIFKTLLMIMFSLSLVACKESETPQTSRRTYIYFSNTLTPEQKNGFSISITFSSRDNKTETVECTEILKSGVVSSDYQKETIWYCDAPKFAEMSTMKLKYNNAVYSTVGPYKLNSVFFNWSATGYSEHSIDNSTGWILSTLSAVNFCEFVLSRIDPFSDSTFCGFNSYPYLLDTFYNSFSNEEIESMAFITWNDQFYGREISAEEKWSDIKKQYQQNLGKQDKTTSVVIYVLGSIVLMIITFISIVILVPKFRSNICCWIKHVIRKKKWKK